MVGIEAYITRMAATETETFERIAQVSFGNKVPSWRRADDARIILCAANRNRCMRFACNMDSRGDAVCGTVADADTDNRYIRMADGIVYVRIEHSMVRYLSAIGNTIYAYYTAVPSKTTMVGLH